MIKKLQGVLILIICMTFTGFAFAKKPVDNDPLVVLGKLVYEDPAFSANGNQSCQSCHHPKAQFSDPKLIRTPELFRCPEQYLQPSTTFLSFRL